jgi:hypothetical protein
MPEANNTATFQGIEFDPKLSLKEIIEVTGSDPADYFKFRFRDCIVSSVTTAAGVTLDKPEQDQIVGAEVALEGFMVDVSPSAICAVIYASQLRLGRIAEGTVDTAVQSDLRLNVRPLRFNDITAAAHYLTSMRFEANAGASEIVRVLSGVGLQIGFNLNRFRKAVDSNGLPQSNGLTGDVHGFIRVKPQAWMQRLRLINRRLVASPGISQEPIVEKTFLTDGVPNPIPRIMDIDGQYDISLSEKWIAIRPLDFVPYLDYEYQTPTSKGVIEKYYVYFDTGASEVYVGDFFGTHEEIQKTGGLLWFRIPDRIDGTEKLKIDVVMPSKQRRPLMVESNFDIEITGDRALKIGSVEAAKMEAVVYQDNLPASGVSVSFKERNDGRSPTVATATGSAITDKDGLVAFTVNAADLDDLKGVIDPVTNAPMVKAPLDRQYGSTILITIPNPLRRSSIEQLELCVRVLPKIALERIPAPISYSKDIEPYLGYHQRFFPWLHTRHSGSGYRRFLDIGNLESVANHIDEMLRRLDMPDSSPLKMPRSRDAPIGLADALRRWLSENLVS